MNKKDLLRFCRYYKGEKDNPFDNAQNASMFWEYERVWVDSSLEALSDKSSEAAKMLCYCLKEYVLAGLTDFESKDDTPATLKALLYNRFCQWNEGGGFEKWYKDTYIKK